MSDTIRPSDTTDRMRTIRRYKLAMYAAVLLGSGAFVGLARLDFHVVGVGAYWLGMAAFLAIWKGTDIQLFDERDCDLERRASHRTLYLFGAAMILAGPALLVLEETTGVAEPAWADPVLYTLSAEFLVFGVIFLWYRHRP